jgi:hypothetical protein
MAGNQKEGKPSISIVFRKRGISLKILLWQTRGQLISNFSNNFQNFDFKD